MAESLKVDKTQVPQKCKVPKRYDHGLAESFMKSLNHIIGSIILKPFIWPSTAYKGDLSNQGIKSNVIFKGFSRRLCI